MTCCVSFLSKVFDCSFGQDAFASTGDAFSARNGEGFNAKLRVMRLRSEEGPLPPFGSSVPSKPSLGFFQSDQRELAFDFL
jgi:hypothetical protein